MAELTPQEKGYEWEREGARLVGGQLQRGSGNRCYARLDVSGYEILWSFKHTEHASFRVSREIIDEARMATNGPEGIKPNTIDIIAYKLGDGTMRGDLDLMQLIAWIREPPALIPATRQDQLRATAKRPPYLRD